MGRLVFPPVHRCWLLIYVQYFEMSQEKRNCVAASVADGHRFDADPDPTFHFDADQYPDSDPTPSFTHGGIS
jgi:hypothetical protein